MIMATSWPRCCLDFIMGLMFQGMIRTHKSCFGSIHGMIMVTSCCDNIDFVKIAFLNLTRCRSLPCNSYHKKYKFFNRCDKISERVPVATRQLRWSLRWSQTLTPSGKPIRTQCPNCPSQPYDHMLLITLRANEQTNYLNLSSASTYSRKKLMFMWYHFDSIKIPPAFGTAGSYTFEMKHMWTNVVYSSTNGHWCPK